MESLFGCDAKLWAKYGTLNGQFGNNFRSAITFSIVRLWLGTTRCDALLLAITFNESAPMYVIYTIRRLCGSSNG